MVRYTMEALGMGTDMGMAVLLIASLIWNMQNFLMEGSAEFNHVINFWASAYNHSFS